MTKRDAIEAMARAMGELRGWTVFCPREFYDMAEVAYERFAEMAKAELQARCSVTGQPLTARERFESECE